MSIRNQVLDAVSVAQTGEGQAEARYTFHSEPNDLGKKLAENKLGESFERKATFKRYDDGWKIERAVL